MLSLTRLRSLAALACLLPALSSVLSAADANRETMQRGAAYALHPSDERLLAIPLESTEVVLDIKPGLLETQVIQSFVNRTDVALEATYLYPLPEGSTLTEFELRYADRIVRSVVKEKREAATAYRNARDQGKKAALVHQQDPMLFSTALANFMPGERVEVAIKIIQPATLTRDHVEVRFPMVTGDKYFPVEATPGALGNAAPNPARRSPRTIASNHVYSFDVQVAGIPVQRIESSSHRIQVKDTGTTPERYKVTLSDDITIPDRDFELHIEMRPEGAMQPSVVTQQTATGNYGLVTFFPPKQSRAAKEIRPRDVLFLIDRSGSMDGARIVNAKLGLEACLDFLSPQDRFQIVTYSSGHMFYQPRWIEGSARAIAEAHRYVRGIQSGGGTELQPALAASLGAFERGERSDREQVLVLLTDGDVGNAASLLELVERNIGQARLFAFGIGDAPNAALLRRIAELGRGQVRFISDDLTIARELEDMFATVDAPVLTQPRLTLLDASGAELAYTMFPEKLPDLFARRPVQATFRAKAGVPATAVIEGVENGRRTSQRVTLRQTALRGDGLEKQFGQRLYSDTELMLFRARHNDERNSIRAEMLATALQYQLVTELTSRVAIDDRVSRDRHEPLAYSHVGQYGPADQVSTGGAVPASAPRGFGGGGMGGRGGGAGGGANDVLVLTPFEVSTDKDVGYAAGNSMSGGRVATPLVITGADISATTPENRVTLRERLAGAARKIFSSDDKSAPAVGDNPGNTTSGVVGPPAAGGAGGAVTVVASTSPEVANFIQEFQGSGATDSLLTFVYRQLAGMSGRAVHRGDALTGTLGLSVQTLEGLLEAQCQQIGIGEAWKTKYAGRHPLNTVDDYVRFLALILSDPNRKP